MVAFGGWMARWLPIMVFLGTFVSTLGEIIGILVAIIAAALAAALALPLGEHARRPGVVERFRETVRHLGKRVAGGVVIPLTAGMT